MFNPDLRPDDYDCTIQSQDMICHVTLEDITKLVENAYSEAVYDSKHIFESYEVERMWESSQAKKKLEQFLSSKRPF